MKERTRIVVTGLVLLMLILWLGFAFHQSPRFAGSFWGGVLAVTGSALMLIPLLYSIIKRIPFLRRFMTRWASMQSLLAWHIYAGVIGPILVLLHTGHKFESALGIALTGMTLIVVLSGFTGRYLMSYFSQRIRVKKEILAGLQKKYQVIASAIAANPQTAQHIGMFSYLQSRFLRWAFAEEVKITDAPLAVQAMRLTDAISDVEYAIASHEKFKSTFKVWLKFHIVISLVLYVLMGLHVWAAIYFGLRWFA